MALVVDLHALEFDGCQRPFEVCFVELGSVTENSAAQFLIGELLAQLLHVSPRVFEELVPVFIHVRIPTMTSNDSRAKRDLLEQLQTEARQLEKELAAAVLR